MHMFKKLFAGIVLALGMPVQGAYSSTTNQEVDITYLGGSDAGADHFPQL